MSRLLPFMLGLVALGPSSSAEDYKRPAWNHCIEQFFDPNMYEWNSYRNTCSQSLRVTFIPNNPGHGGGCFTIDPGRKDTTGDTRRDMQEKAGYQLYVCPAGYIPVDDRGEVVYRTSVKNYKCKSNR